MRVLHKYLTITILLSLCIFIGFGCSSTESEGVSPLIGAWGEGYYGEGEYMSVAFYKNGIYIYYQSFAYESGTAGVEIGNYTYDEETMTLTVTPLYDSNGTGGFANNGTSATSGKTYSVVNNSLIISDGMAVDTLPKVIKTANTVVGSYGDGLLDGSYMTIVLFNNGRFLLYMSDNPEWDTDNGGGVEYGTCIYDHNLKTVTFDPEIDQNGDDGVCSYNQPITMSVTISLNSGTFCDSDDCTKLPRY